MEVLRLPVRHRRVLLPVLIGLFLAVPAVAVADHVFGDVADASTHANGIHYVAEAGITSGCTAENFCPGANVTRGQMATFLHRTSGNAPGVAANVNAASVTSSAIVTVRADRTVASATTNGVTATCPAGTAVVGGGGTTNSPTWRLETSVPLGENSWYVFYRSTAGAGPQIATVFARCLRVGP